MVSIKKNSSEMLIGIVGFGVVGKRRFNIIKNYRDFKISAISDADPNNLKDLDDEIFKYQDYRDLILSSNCQIIFISLPNKYAADATKLALKQGKHVFCEKPPARYARELLSIRRIIKGKSLKLKYGFNHRYHSSVIKASEIIQTKKLGRMLTLRGVYGKSKIISFDQSDWRSKRSEAGGGILLDQGIHMIDLMRYFAGEEFTKIFSIIKNSFWKHDVEDNAFALMETKSGIVAQIHSSATQWKHKFNLEIIFEKGALVFGGILTGSKSYGEETLTIISSKPDVDKGIPEELTFKYNDDISWSLEIDEFLNSVKSNKKILHGNIDEAILTMRLIEKIYTSDPNWKKLFYME